MVIIGVSGPDADDDGEDGGSTEVDQNEAILEWIAKEIDETLAGALKEVMTFNQKAFRDGSVSESATPTLRLKTSGTDRKLKIRLFLYFEHGLHFINFNKIEICMLDKALHSPRT